MGCIQCGAPLADTPYVTKISCTYCKKEQPNPTPLPEGHEVIHGTSLGVVAGCEGPEVVRVRVDGNTITARFVELVPVAKDETKIKPGMPIFADEAQGFGWFATFVRKTEGAMVKVLHENEDFRTPFFDKTVPIERVRVRVGPHAPKPMSLWALRPTSDKIFSIIFALFLLPFVLIVLLFVAGMIRGCFG